MLMVIVGVPRTEYTLNQAVLQARLRGLEVAVADTASMLADVARGVRTVTLDDPPLPDDSAAHLAPLAPRFVLSFTEFHTLLAAQIRERLGLAGVPASVEERVRNKSLTRRRLCERGLTTVRFALTTLDDLAMAAGAFEPPFVIKPVDLTGSIGVAAVRAREDVVRYHRRFVDTTAETGRGRKLMLESFVSGDEYSVEGICVAGRFEMLAVTRKYTDGFPTFAEVGHTLPAGGEVDHDACRRYVQDVVRALEIDTAPIHAEVKVDGSTVELIEIHTRFAGDSIPELYERAFGSNCFALFYDALLHGRLPALSPASRVAGIQFFDACELQRLRLSSQPWPGVCYTLSVRDPEAGGSSSLDNFRILNERAGHVIFDARTVADAERFVAAVRAS